MYVTLDGYVVLDGREFEHRAVWEAVHGPIPEGCQIHHKNENRTDNRIENLECLTVGEHKRLHAGWIRNESGEFVAKKCKTCGAIRPLSEYYVNYRKEHFIACKACWRIRAKRIREEKKAAKLEKQLCL